MTKKPLGLKPLEHTDIINIIEPIIFLDNPKQEEYLKKRLIEALEDLPKPTKTGYLMMTPSEDKIEKIKSFTNDEISFKRDLPHEFGFGFKRRDME